MVESCSAQDSFWMIIPWQCTRRAISGWSGLSGAVSTELHYSSASNCRTDCCCCAITGHSDSVSNEPRQGKDHNESYLFPSDHHQCCSRVLRHSLQRSYMRIHCFQMHPFEILWMRNWPRKWKLSLLQKMLQLFGTFGLGMLQLRWSLPFKKRNRVSWPKLRQMAQFPPQKYVGSYLIFMHLGVPDMDSQGA